MSETSREIRIDLISAGKKAARELIAVAKEKIVHKDMSKDPLAADKMKPAAAAKTRPKTAAAPPTDQPA